jgi:hypothetical protein
MSATLPEIVLRKPRGQPVLPVRFVLPDLPDGSSPELRLAIATMLTPHPDVPLRRADERVRGEATDALAAINPLLGPASVDVITAFLWPVADAVEFVPEEDVFFRRVNVLHMATQDIPHVAWTQQACMALCRSAGRYLPSVQQIIEAVEPAVRPLLQRERALKQIIGQRDA